MNFKMIHNNFNVSNLERSTDFYNKALGLIEKDRIKGPDFVIVFMGNDQSSHLLELTETESHKGKYDLGDNEFHLAFETDDYDAALAKHKEMDCVCYENKEMGLYFINDPDGYWLEILSPRN